MTHAYGPGHTHTDYLATLAAGHDTGWWDEHGTPAPWPDDFLDPDTEWRTDTPLTTDRQPF